MDSGKDLAIISGSGELPSIINNFCRKAIYISFNKSKTFANEQV